MSEGAESGPRDRKSFLESVPADLALLREARAGLQADPEESRVSLRRFSQFIAREAERLGLDEVAHAASALAHEESDQLLARLDRLESELESIQGAPSAAEVLIVEDEPTTQHLVQTALRQPGREIHSAATAEEARKILDDRSIDLVVLDLILPDADGRHLLMEMGRERDGRRTSVVVLTAKGTATTRAECFAYGASAFLEKPLDIEALKSVVNGVLSRRRSQHWPEAQTAPDLPDRNQLRDAFLRHQSTRHPDDSSLVLAIIDTDPRGLGWDEQGRVKEEVQEVDRRIVEVLDEALESEDMVGRWGVNELLLVLVGRDATTCVRLLERAQTLMSREDRAFVAGVNQVTPEATFEDAISWAGRLASEARMSAGNGILHTTLTKSRTPFVLVVEDDPITASLVKHRLERSGFEVEHYENGLRGLEAIRRSVPDLVVLDIRLPGMDGFEILARMKAQEGTRDIRTVILTGMGRETDVSRAFELGADDYLVKPFSPVELTARVLRLVRR